MIIIGPTASLYVRAKKRALLGLYVLVSLVFASNILAQMSNVEAINQGGSSASNTMPDPPLSAPNSFSVVYQYLETSVDKYAFAFPCFTYSSVSTNPADWKFYKVRTHTRNGSYYRSENRWGDDMGKYNFSYTSEGDLHETLVDEKISPENIREGGRGVSTSRYTGDGWEKHLGVRYTYDTKTESNVTMSKIDGSFPTYVGDRTTTTYTTIDGEPAEGNGTFVDPGVYGLSSAGGVPSTTTTTTPTRQETKTIVAYTEDNSDEDRHDITTVLYSSTQAYSLSNEYTNQQLLEAAKSKILPFDDNFPGIGFTGDLFARLIIDKIERDIYLRQFRFKFSFNSSEPISVSWLELFTPQDGPGDVEDLNNATVTQRTWSGPGPESEIFEVLAAEMGWRRVLMPDFVFYKPETSSNDQWLSSQQRLLWEEPYVFSDSPTKSDDLKFKVTFPIAISQAVIDQVDIEVAIFSYRWPTTPNWVSFNLGEIGRLSPDKREVWCTISNSTVKSSIMPPQPNESEVEFASFDWIADVSISSYDDSNNFASGMRSRYGPELVSARGLGNPSRVSAPDPRMPSSEVIPPWTAKANKKYFIAAGATYIEVRLPRDGSSAQNQGSSARALCREQADWLYVSVHGWHSANGHYPSGCIEVVDEVQIGGDTIHDYVLPEEVEWRSDLNVVIIAGCSVLDINDYNKVYGGSTDSPGERWEATGPEVLLGYNASGPRDRGIGDAIASEWVATQASVGKIEAWARANRNRKAWNACAIHAGHDYYYFHRPKDNLFAKLTSKWTKVPKSDW